ncbi:MAG: heme b synthase [Desulfobacteraceae bacterium]
MEEHRSHTMTPRLVAWEITRSCNLSCVHCRAAAERGPYNGELDTRTCMRILDEIAEISKPIIILTGGEPLLREDVFELARYGTGLGLRMVMATNGTLFTPELIGKLQVNGIQRVSISLDGATAESHDRFRQVIGAFDRAVAGIEALREAGVEFQVNTTVTRHNLEEVPKLLDLAVSLGAAAHHLFLLVPTGRARELVNQEIEAQEYERLLRWFYHMREKAPLHLKATCAPHYYRILRQEARAKGEKVDFQTYGLDAVTRGCLAGTAFCFISHDGIVQPCGYLELACGDLKISSFKEVWEGSDVFRNLRDFSAYKGKCGRCEYLRVCGGCRARAYEATGDYLEKEPLCLYEPARDRRAEASPGPWKRAES